MLLSFLSEELRTLGDPRLQSVTFTEVQVSKDCKHAYIFWSAFKLNAAAAIPENGAPLGDFLTAEEQAIIGEGLGSVKSLLRRRVAEALDLRYVPDLHFKYDEAGVRGMRIDALLSKAGL